METEFWANVYYGLRIQWSHPTTWAVFVSVIVLAVPAVWFLVKRRGWPRVATVTAAVWFGFFLASTWRILPGEPLSWTGVGTFYSSLSDIDAWGRGLGDLAHARPFAVANTLVTIPLGALLVFAARGSWLVVPILLGTVFGVESLQSLGYGGSVADLVSNVLGAAIGVISASIYLWASRLVERQT